MRINTLKVRLVKSSFGGLHTPFDGAILFFKFLQGFINPWFL
jgi:hypothetical protein